MKHMKQCLQMTAAAFSVLFAMQNPVQAFAAAKPEYISDIVIAADADEDYAKKFLKDAGYRVLDRNIGDPSRAVYIGYLTTTDPEKAITDIKTMNATGNFSFAEYEKVLEDQRASLKQFSEDLIGALKEYRQNYSDGVTKAVIAHDSMNLYRDDDTGMLMGDLFLNEIAEEMTNYDSLSAEEKKKHGSLTTITMQGNSQLLGVVLRFLALAQDTGKDTWTARLKESGGLDGMQNSVKAEHPTLQQSKRDALLVKEYDSDAKLLAAAVESMRKEVNIYLESGAPKEGTAEEIAAYFDEHPEENASVWQTGGSMYLMLQTLEYGSETLGDLLLDESFDFQCNPDDRMELYPLLETMTEGQRRLLGYVSFEQLLTNGTLDQAGWEKAKAETEQNIAGQEVTSIYEGVRRRLFTAKGIALTDAAQRFGSATGKSWADELAGSIGAVAAMPLFVGAVILSGITIWATKASFNRAAAAAVNTGQANALGQFASRQVSESAVRQSVYAHYKDGFVKYLRENMVTTGGDVFRLDHTKPLSFDNIAPEYKNDLITQYRSSLDDDIYAGITVSVTGEDGQVVKKTLGVNEYLDTVEKYEQEIEKGVERTQLEGNNVAQAGEAAGGSKLGSFLRFVGVVVSIVFALIAVAALATMIYYLVKQKENNSIPKPEILVNRSTDSNGATVYTAYDGVVDLNRTALEEDEFDVLQRVELEGGPEVCNLGNGGMEWISLYVSHDSAAGKPILASSLQVVTNGKSPVGKTAVSTFGSESAQNIKDKMFVDRAYKDENTMYLYFEAANASTTASTVSTGVTAVACVGFAFAGAALSFLIRRVKANGGLAEEAEDEA